MGDNVKRILRRKRELPAGVSGFGDEFYKFWRESDIGAVSYMYIFNWNIVHNEVNQIYIYVYTHTHTHTHLDSIFKSKDITLPTKVHLLKAMVFPVVMYGCESWTVKKAEC